MSDSESSSSDLSELQDGVDLRSETGSNDSAADSEPETEAETERLDPSPQKARDNNAATEDAAEERNESATPNTEREPEPVRPGLTAQDILRGERQSSEAEDDEDQTAATASGRSQVKPPPELAGKKRKRSGSMSAFANVQSSDGGPLKKRSSSTRFDRKSTDATKHALGIMREHHEEAIVSSADEGRDANDAIMGDETPGLISDHNASNNRRDPEGDGDVDDNKEDMGELSDGAGDDDDGQVNEAMEEEDGEGDGEGDEAEAGAETTGKSEDERKQDQNQPLKSLDFINMHKVAKKKVAMDALVPIEKLFAIFRDRLFDERWAQISAELTVLNNPNTTHPDYLAMRPALDARREEKLKLEEVTLGYKTKALEAKILSYRAQIHGQYFQTVRKIREQYMEKLNEQFSRIQRERRQWKTKEPHFVYNFDTKRSKQIAYQTAYNKEVSILSGIAKHVGFPGAPEIHGATANDIEDDLRAMNIKPPARQVSYAARIASSTRADEAAAEEQFLEKTPWANPQHPAHQQTHTLDRKNHDPNRASTTTPSNRITDLQRDAAGSASAIGITLDPTSGLAESQVDAVVNGSSPFEQSKRNDAAKTNQQLQSKDDNTSSTNGDRTTNTTAFTYNATTPSSSTLAAENGIKDKSGNVPGDTPTVSQSYGTPVMQSTQTSEMYGSTPSHGPVQNASSGGPGRDEHEAQDFEEQDGPAQERERYQSPTSGPVPPSGTADRRFHGTPAHHEGITANSGVAQSSGVR